MCHQSTGLHGPRTKVGCNSNRKTQRLFWMTCTTKSLDCLHSFSHSLFMGGIWQLALSNHFAPCPCEENDVLRDPCVSQKCPALDLPYLCLLCFGTFMLLVQCVFTQLWPMDSMMGLFISACSALFVFYVTGFYKYIVRTE